MGHTTDRLVELARAVGDCTPEREMDMLLATGEQVTVALLAIALTGMGYPAISLTGAQAGIITDNAHTRARIVSVDQERIRKELEKGQIVVVAGFQGIGGTERDDHPRPGRFGYHRGGSGSGFECRGLRDLHRCGRRLYRRPAPRTGGHED